MPVWLVNMAIIMYRMWMAIIRKFGGIMEDFSGTFLRELYWKFLTTYGLMSNREKHLSFTWSYLEVFSVNLTFLATSKGELHCLVDDILCSTVYCMVVDHSHNGRLWTWSSYLHTVWLLACNWINTIIPTSGDVLVAVDTLLWLYFLLGPDTFDLDAS